MSDIIGTKPEQVPSNGHLGGMAYQDPEGVIVRPASSATPQKAGDLVFELVSDTSLKIKVRGADGVVRSATLALA